MDIIKRIWAYTARYKGRFTVAASLLIMLIIVNLISPHLSRILIDDVIMGGKRSLFSIVLIALVVAALLKSITNYGRNYLFDDLSQKCLYDLRNDMYTHLQGLPYSFYDNNRIGELMSRMTGDLEGIRVFLQAGIQIVMENLIYFFGTAFTLFSMNAKLAFVTLSIAPLLAWVTRRFDKIIRPLYREIREQNAVLNTVVQENIAGVRVVKAFAREDFEIEKFSKENSTVKEKNILASMIHSKYIPLLDFISSLCVVFLLWYGGRMVAMGEISLGTLVAFNGYLWMMLMPMRMMGWIVNMLAQAISSGQRVFNILDTGSPIKEIEQPYTPEQIKGDVKFEDVSFYYREQQVLFHISLDAPAGKTIAIMGATGSGKTSIINLISRSYDVSHGRVLVDGVDVKHWSLNRLRSEIGIVMQDTFLFSDTIEGNILYGNPNATREQVVEAAKIASAHSFIMEMPEGYDTIVGERGMGLSGGQKQRIAIARAVLKNPRILIMDDCTSAVDMETEAEIQQALKTVMEGRTTFIIAHRISSVKNADEIILLDKGIILERGTHQQLIAKKGKYYDIYRQQYKDLDKYESERQVM